MVDDAACRTLFIAVSPNIHEYRLLNMRLLTTCNLSKLRGQGALKANALLLTSISITDNRKRCRPFSTQARIQQIDSHPQSDIKTPGFASHASHPHLVEDNEGKSP
jgi:hypothetical protein